MIKNIKKITVVSLFLSLLSYQNTFAAQGTYVITFKSPLKNVGSVSELLGIFVQWIIQLGTVAAVLAFIYVGFQFVAARGKPEEIKKARDAFLWTVIGTLVLIASSVLVEVVKTTLLQGGITTT